MERQRRRLVTDGVDQPNGLPKTDTLELPPAARPDAGAELTDTCELDGDEARLTAADAPEARPLLVLTHTLEERYRDLAFHGRSVAGYSAMLGGELDLDPATTERIALAGELHDVGKVGVADEILRTPGPLSDEEWDQIHRHPQIGADLLFSSNLDDIAQWVLAHHERPDGRGYPFGIPAEDIPLEALILSVADAYDAMRTDRVYQPALSHEQAAEELLLGSGTQFDPIVVERFLQALSRL
jgi:HD-GYP domain-containing protein (c-di-GMP phosphodiesterase class II)